MKTNANNKSVLITIIIGLIICVPCTIIGILNRDANSLDNDNINHETFYNGYLWFYDSNNNLINKYECKTENCKLTESTIDDKEYGINYYKDSESLNIKLINDKYAFVTDGSVTFLYDVQSSSKVETYKAVKNYGATLEDNNYIVQNNEGKWGVIKLDNSLYPVLPIEYDYIGLKDDLNENNEIKTKKFIALKDGKWFMIDNNSSILTNNFERPIINYTDEYIITKSFGEVHIYNYNGSTEYLENLHMFDSMVVENFVVARIDKQIMFYKDLNEEFVRVLEVNNNDNITFDKQGSRLNILVNGESKDSLAIN